MMDELKSNAHRYRIQRRFNTQAWEDAFFLAAFPPVYFPNFIGVDHGLQVVSLFNQDVWQHKTVITKEQMRTCTGTMIIA